MPTSPSPTSSHDASASFTGYLFQARYALLRGLQEGRRSPSHALSIERFDDVAFENAGRPIELIQTKHHGCGGDPTDMSADVWKTLHIWISHFLHDPTAAHTTRFLFLTTSAAPDGSALSMLRNTDAERDESRAGELLVAAAKASRNAITAPDRAAFLALTSATRRLLVHNIWVFDHAPTILDVREEIESVLHYSALPEQITHLTDHLEGWWFNRVVTALADPQVATIPLASIQNKVSDLRERFRLGQLALDDTIEAMPPVTELPPDERMFIRQMRLVDISDNEIRATVHDYYRAYEQRSRWARENLLLDGEVDRYDRGLRDVWHRRFLACTADVSPDSDERTKVGQGRQVFRWAREYQKPFRNRDELWLPAGSFQMLADAVRLGWHPNYETLLTPRKDET